MFGIHRLLVTAVALLALTCATGRAHAQALPVAVHVSGNVATVEVGNPLNPLAEVTLTFDQPVGLSAASLGVSARLVNPKDPALLSRLPEVPLEQIDPAFPMLLTVEPPRTGGLRFRTVRAEVHTHALTYTAGSSYRLFKAPLNGNFYDITDEIAPGSVRARGTTGGFSQFLVLTDLRETDAIVSRKIASLRARIATLPASERPAFNGLLNAVETAVAGGHYGLALYRTQQIANRAIARSGTFLQDQWRATRDADNQAGDLIAGAATLKFSIAYLRDYGD